jgi:AraC-like DNA-binding protein
MRKQQEMKADLTRFLQAEPPVETLSWQVRKLIECAHEQLFNPALNVAMLVTTCRMRDHNISCRFKQEVGISMRDYIEAQRLEAANQLLQQGTYTVSEVAHSVGYAHLQTFYQAFGRRFRCSPGSVRGRSGVSDLVTGQRQSTMQVCE